DAHLDAELRWLEALAPVVAYDTSGEGGGRGPGPPLRDRGGAGRARAKPGGGAGWLNRCISVVRSTTPWPPPPQTKGRTPSESGAILEPLPPRPPCPSTSTTPPPSSPAPPPSSTPGSAASPTPGPA